MLFKPTDVDPVQLDRVKDHFQASIETKRAVLNQAAGHIVRAAGCIAGCLQNQGKVLACGNGGSASDAQHFSAEMLGKLERQRSGFAALALTADTATLTAVGNDYDFADIFARQVQALGRPGDILLAISTSGNSPNIINAVQTAQSQQMPVIALTGRNGGDLASLLSATDIEIRVPSERTMRIQETHILTIHCLCDLVDQLILGEEK